MNIQLKESLYLDMLSMPRGTRELQELFISTYFSKLSYDRDDYGNVYVRVGDIPDVAFMSHLDTVHRPDVSFVETETVREFVSLGYVSLSPGATANCLGADCTTGIWIMLNMILNQVPGLYCFFLDEEVGCLGSQWAVTNLSWTGIDHAISFDRYGTDSIITHQMGINTASYEFVDELASRLNAEGMNYARDDQGVYTDSYSFVGTIPNCTNLSVGYYNQHTPGEYQDLVFLSKLIDVCCSISWSGLPTGETEDFLDYPSYWEDTTPDEESYSYFILDKIEELLHSNPQIEDDLEKLIEKYKSDDVKLNDPFYVG